MKTLHHLLIIVALSGICALNVRATNDSSITAAKALFDEAFLELKDQVEGKQEPDFERAVFISENPYWNNTYSFARFQKVIDNHLLFIQRLIAANDQSNSIDFSVKVNANGRFNIDEIRYTEEEKRELYHKALSNWAIFTYITDTTDFYLFKNLPFTYVSNDPFGMKEWASSQVLSLLTSKEQKGNCFALTALYKIFSDRLNAGAYICTAPQHIYIQHQDHKGHLYNVELATAGHPGDGVIQTLTYTTNEAIMSNIALRKFDEKQNIGLCLVNLAKSYEHKFNTRTDNFILKCAELALKHDPKNLNALLLKQQVLDARVTEYALKKGINECKQLKNDNQISSTLSILENHLAKLYELGYRQMPLDMQEILLNGFKNKEDYLLYTKDKNPSPFTTVKPKDPKDAEYVSLSHGLFQEVFTHKTLETYGHFTFNTETKAIVFIDTSGKNNFLIDPVAFAFDLGARMYDARVGRFISTDPSQAKYPSWSPYSAFLDNPLVYTDPDGKDVVLVIHTTKEGDVGHAAIAVENYKAVEKTVVENGKTVTKTEYVATGTFTFFELGPAEGISGKVGALFDTEANFGKQDNVTLDQITNTALSAYESNAPEGAILLKTNYVTDQAVRKALETFKQENPEYNAVCANCSDFAKTGAETATGQEFDASENLVPLIGTTVPNKLFQEVAKASNTTIIKDPGEQVKKSFEEAFEGTTSEDEKTKKQ